LVTGDLLFKWMLLVTLRSGIRLKLMSLVSVRSRLCLKFKRKKWLMFLIKINVTC